MKELTTVFDAISGQKLAEYADHLNQIQLGRDFYVGQIAHVVKEIKKDVDGNLLIFVERK